MLARDWSSGLADCQNARPLLFEKGQILSSLLCSGRVEMWFYRRLLGIGRSGDFQLSAAFLVKQDDGSYMLLIHFQLCLEVQSFPIFVCVSVSICRVE